MTRYTGIAFLCTRLKSSFFLSGGITGGLISVGITITFSFIKTCSFSSHTSFLVSHSAIFVSSLNASPLLK